MEEFERKLGGKLEDVKKRLEWKNLVKQNLMFNILISKPGWASLDLGIRLYG